MQHQRELHETRLADGLDRFADDEGGDGGNEGKTWKRFQSYKGEAGLPKEVENLRVRLYPLSGLLECFFQGG